MEERQLGSSYVLGERLGAGAMGAVYRGRDQEGREYAFKVLRSELAEEPALVQRFVQERSALISVDHPDVVRMHDLVVEGSTLAIVMDLVSGSDLRSVLRDQGSLPPAEGARLGAGIAAGLSAVHRAGLVHRDVKPENVLIDDTVAPPTPKVTDFGIARIADASAATRSSMMVGTPNYMAPETSEGATPTPAVDVYALGVLLYEMCVGVTPFEGGSYLAVIRRHADSSPGRPDGIPDQLWDAIQDMLAKDPAQRPSAAQVAPFLAALSEEYRGQPSAPALSEPPVSGTAPNREAASTSTAHAVPAAQSQETKARRSRAVPAVLGLGLAAVVAAAAVWWFGLRGDEDQTASETTPSPTAASTSPEAEQGDVEQTAEESVSVGSDPEENSDPPETDVLEVPQEMPDVVGMTLSAARTALRGTTVTVVEDFDEAARDNEVLAQDVAAGVDLPDEVTLTVAKQPVTIYLDQLEDVSSERDFDSGAAQVSGESYPRSLFYGGYYADSATSSWNLSRGFRTFRAIVGRSDDTSNPETEVQVEFFLDQRSVRTEVVSFGEPVDVEIDVADALRLEVVATSLDGEEIDIVLGDARLLGLPGEVPKLDED